jgi:hypothetical protein
MIVLGVTATVSYFIPWIVATGKKNSTGIFWLNLLAGWTAFGWLAAFIWAIIDKKEGEDVQTYHTPDKYDQLQKLDDLRSKGILTTEEFIVEKEKIMRS